MREVVPEVDHHSLLRRGPTLRGVRAGLRLWGLVLFAGLAAANATTVLARDPAAVISEAIKEYREALDSQDRNERLRKFRVAQLMFRQVVEGTEQQPGIQNAALYVNLGNAALGAEDLGGAILAYRRALDLDSGNHTAQTNLQFARSQLPAWVPQPEPEGVLDSLLGWSRLLSRQQWQRLAAIAFLLSCVSAAASLKWQSGGMRWVAILGLVAWAVALSATWFNHDPSLNQGVIVLDEVYARAADSARAPIRFSEPLPGGVEVEILRQQGEWLQIRLADGRDAWVPASSCARIRMPRAASSAPEES